MPVMVAEMTLGELLGRCRPGLVHLAGPEDPGRPVRWAHSTELVRPGRYLRGGELVLTVGSSLRTKVACETFVADLAEVGGVGVAAIGLGLGDVHDRPPRALVAACVRYGVPLLTVASSVPFQSLTELIAEHRIAGRLADTRRSSRLVATLLDAMAGADPSDAPLAEVASELGGRLVVTDAVGEVEVSVGAADPETTPVQAVLPGDPPGWLLWYPPADHGPASESLDELAHPIAVWRQERRRVHDHAEHDLGGLLALVLDGLAEPSALGGHLTTPGPLTATAWSSDDTGLLRTRFGTDPRAALGEVVIVFVADPARSKALARARGLPTGIGETVAAGEVARTVRGAIEALRLSRHRGRPVEAHELATVEALLDHVPDERLRPFVDQMIAPLAAHDRTHHADLVATLRAYLHGGAAVVPVARAMFLHPNTLRHRLERVREITGRNPFELADQAAFSVALHVEDRGWHRQATGREPAPAPRRPSARSPATPAATGNASAR